MFECCIDSFAVFLLLQSVHVVILQAGEEGCAYRDSGSGTIEGTDNVFFFFFLAR